MFKPLIFLHLYLFFIFLRLNLWTWSRLHFINQYFHFTFSYRLLLSFRHLEFSKIRNFNGLSHVRDQCESPCQISSKSVKWLRRYGGLTVFTMAAVRRLGFWKFIFLTIWALKRHILHNHAKFREDLSIPCCDMGICVVLKITKNFNDLSPVGGQSASACQISTKSVKRLRRYGD